jgi:hypothetical protein
MGELGRLPFASRNNEYDRNAASLGEEDILLRHRHCVQREQRDGASSDQAKQLVEASSENARAVERWKYDDADWLGNWLLSAFLGRGHRVSPDTVASAPFGAGDACVAVVFVDGQNTFCYGDEMVTST